MAKKSTLNKDATKLIDEAFEKMEPNIKAMCDKLRELIHQADPDIAEDWKWGPNFNHNGMVCGVWGFKKHASIHFYKGTIMADKAKLFNFGEGNEKVLSIKFTNISQINDTLIIDYVKEAVELNILGIKPKPLPKVVDVPHDLQTLLDKNPKAKQVFENFAYSHKKEYVEWVTAAKRDETRQARLQKTIEMLAKGKGRNDKYKK
jgi:uncharacterized protein YdeI (YjbR/CyaY-like superfamily)